MQTYKIQYKNNSDFYSLISVSGSNQEHRTINLPKKAADRLKVGDTIRVIRDNLLDIEDYVYLHRGGMTFNTKPASYDKHSCKYYIENIPGLFQDGSLDRATFKIALAGECLRRGFGFSLVAWRNLRNVFLWDTYSPFVR